MLIVRSPVRISFGGGGTDLPAYYEKFGGCVVSTAINKYFYTVLEKRGDGKIQIISADLRVVDTWQDIAKMDVRGNPLEIPLAVLKDLGSDVSVNLFLASEIPPGTGLGSSASVCVNLLKMLTAYKHISLSKYELAERAYHLARNVLGRPVGKQDEYASAFGGLNYISFYQDGTTHVEPLDLEPELVREFQSCLLLFFTGASHHSWTILGEQEEATRTSTGMAVDYLHEIRQLAEPMKLALIAGELRDFGLLLNEAWQVKRRISSKISNARIDEMYQAALENGALGGKITGAGGGGFLLLFCPQIAQQQVREALIAKGAREMGFSFDFKGAQVVADDPFIDGDENGGTRWTFVPTAPLANSRSFLGKGAL